MPTRRFNYTGRRPIDHQRVSIELQEPDDGSPPTFTVELNLSELDLPADAPVIITAQRTRNAMRFPWGTAAALKPAADCRLAEVPTNPNFRVTVLAPDGSGKLLALVDNIQPKRANRRESLLWLKEDDLGQEVWRLDFGDGDSGNPTLLVNRNIPGISAIARQDDAFLAPLLPAVFRSILIRALLVEEFDPSESDDQAPWGRWMGFVHEFFTDEYPEFAAEDNKEKVSEWIDNAVAAFARTRFPASDKFAAAKRD